MNWYLGVWKKYVTFTGRARRTEYWMFLLFNMIIAFGLGLTDGLLGLMDSNGNGLLGGIYSLAVLLPSIAVGVRRMHDTDHSGWWIIVPIVNLVFALTEGTRGPNRFGSDPKLNQVSGVSGVPAGWFPDPIGKHQFRYWDSAQWTSSVADGGVTTTDPM